MIKTYILEEHNEAFFVWYYLKSKNYFFENSTLLHIDHHSDLTPPLMKSYFNQNEKSLSIIKRITYKELSISSFIIPAIYMRMFDKMIWLKSLDINGYKTLYKQIHVEKMKNTFFSLIDKNLSINKNDVCFELTISGISSIIEKISENFILDIDLDFFSCNENPYYNKTIKIQISEDEYKSFIYDDYHYFRFLFPNFYINAIEECGYYYYILNNFEDKIIQKHKVPIEEAKHRVDILVDNIKCFNHSPFAITISKSIYSGYTPKDQAYIILDYLLERLSSIYNLDIIVGININ